jgi:hypothetical protein
VVGRPTVLAAAGCGSLALAASVRSDSLLAIVVVFSPLLLVLVSRAGVRRSATVAAATVVLLGAGCSGRPPRVLLAGLAGVRRVQRRAR